MSDDIDTTDDDLDPDIADQFEKWYAKRQEEEARKRDRAKQPKDFGEFLDKVADAVLDRAEHRAAKRREAVDDQDQEPARGRGDSSFARFWGGSEKTA